MRKRTSSAPWTWSLVTMLLYVFTLPLYLLKIVLLPRDIIWVATLVFLVSIFPTRVLCGWAYARSDRLLKEGLTGLWFSRGCAKLLTVVLVGIYVFLLYFTQFVGEHGQWGLFEQHAFLLPTPLW